MTEREQLEALVAEYAARGLFVATDFPAAEALSPIDGVRTLDLVGWQGGMREGRPAVIVEIANRSRPAARRRKPPWRDELRTDEHGRLERFERIAQSIRAQEPDAWSGGRTQFVIRFFDVTAEQSSARSVEQVKVRAAADIAGELRRTRAVLALAERSEDAELRGLAYGREWARWLRLLGRRFPARGRTLPEADLRTIQKELHDRLVLPLTPDAYKPLHAALLASLEGGDVNWHLLLDLGPWLDKVLGWAERAILVDAPARSADTFERAAARLRRQQESE